MSGWRVAVLRLAVVALAGIWTLGAAPGTARAQDQAVLVFAAASLKNALDEIAANWHGASGKTATISYAASSALAKQIEAGAPADVFVSADLDWMDYLQDKDLVNADTRTSLLGNRIVLVAPADSAVNAKIAPGFDLAALLGDGRLAMADPNAVPAGKYSKAALEALQVWPSVQDRVAPAENVRAALALVGRNEAPLGIVYRTDAAADQGVKVVDTVPDETHPPIVYPAALTAESTNPAAPAFLAYVASDAARPIFERWGFTVLP